MSLGSEEVRPFILVAMVPAIVLLLWALGVVLCREWVRQELEEKGFVPEAIRWRFFASGRLACCFTAVYRDAGGVQHRARCSTLRHRHEVRWETEL